MEIVRAEIEESIEKTMWIIENEIIAQSSVHSITLQRKKKKKTAEEIRV